MMPHFNPPEKTVADAADLLPELLAKLPDLKGRRLTAALSGGVDSVVLLHLLARARDELGVALAAVHVHHGLNPRADDWAAWCERYCAGLDIPFQAAFVRVDSRGQGIEAAARRERYAVFSRLETDFVALGHHRDDQIETFWLAALRGGGVRALSAMPAERLLAGGGQQTVRLLRPLLPFSRNRIEAYARSHGLDWLDDDSNRDPALLRNWLRHHLLPQLSARLPHAERHILAAITQLQQERALLAEIEDADWQALHPQGVFDCRRWQALSPARRRSQLLRFAREHALGSPNPRSLAAFESSLKNHAGGHLQWPLPHGYACADRGRLFAVPDGFTGRFPWHNKENHFSGSLKAAAEALGLRWRRAAWGLSDEILSRPGSIRSLKSGDTLRLAVGSKDIAKLLQEARVPAFVRPYWPLALDENGEVAAAANLRAAANGCANGWLLEAGSLKGYLWQPESPKQPENPNAPNTV